MTKSAVIYARFSSDLQRDRSIEDQIAYCREYCVRQGWEVVATFEDRAITGASMMLRPGIQALVRAARTQAFQFAVAESMSRIGRDQEDRAGIRKRLNFAGVQIATPVDGVVAPLVDGIRAVIDMQQLEDMKGAIRRGMQGVVRDGRHPGGKAYGYRAVPGKPGELDIIPEEAEVVRRIFRDYLAGEGARDIAAKLNAESVAPPRGSYWRANTIGGHLERKTGILQNRLYVGQIHWNRASTPRDPDTGQRVRRAKPEIEWKRAEAPHLRIVDDETFEAAQRHRRARCEAGPRDRARAKRMLSGLLRCGCCGAGMSKKDTDHGRPRIICTQMKEGGSCDNRRAYYLDDIERRVVDGLVRELGTPEALRYFVDRYNERRRQIASTPADKRAQIAAALVATQAKLDRAVAGVIDGRLTQAEADTHLPALRQERDALSGEMAQFEMARVVSFRRAAVDSYVADLSRLAEVINQDQADGSSQAALAIRSYIRTVTVDPAPAGTAPVLRLQGTLDSLTDNPALEYVGGSFGAGCPFPTAPPAPGRTPLVFTLILPSQEAA